RLGNAGKRPKRKAIRKLWSLTSGRKVQCSGRLEGQTPLSAKGRPRRSQERQYSSWDRARLSVVVPIGVIVAVAIVCIVVAVLSSAQRADEVAVEHERQVLSHAISNYGERVLREVESVATSEGAIRNIRVTFDPDWAKERVGLWLQTFFDHDDVFVFDG